MGDLLDDMTALLGLPWLSELHTNPDVPQLLATALQSIPPGKYSVEQWAEAVRYVTGDKALTPKTEQEARAMLCK